MTIEATRVGFIIGKIAVTYFPSAMAARTAGAENPIVDETNPPIKPIAGWNTFDKILYSPPDRGKTDANSLYENAPNNDIIPPINHNNNIGNAVFISMS